MLQHSALCEAIEANLASLEHAEGLEEDRITSTAQKGRGSLCACGIRKKPVEWNVLIKPEKKHVAYLHKSDDCKRVESHHPEMATTGAFGSRLHHCGCAF